MNLKLICIGKTEEEYLRTGIAMYEKRLVHYTNFETIIIPELKGTKNLSPQEIKEQEAKLLLKHFSKNDYVVLLDENGKQYRSVEFAQFLQKQMNSGIRNLIFVVGGAFGFAPSVYEQAQAKISLSSMTFSHQMIRLFFVEQCYRGFSILKNEPYHNE